LADSGSGRRWSSDDRGERDDDDAAAAPAALDSNQLRGHRQQIGKSAALTVGVFHILNSRNAGPNVAT
jgi:hypothetical protein